MTESTYSKSVRNSLDYVSYFDDEHLRSTSKEKKSDDEPEKQYCICRQPFNNRFMVSNSLLKL